MTVKGMGKKCREIKLSVEDALHELAKAINDELDIKPYKERVEKLFSIYKSEAMFLIRANELNSGVRARLIAVRIHNEVCADTRDKLNKLFGV